MNTQTSPSILSQLSNFKHENQWFNSYEFTNPNTCFGSGGGNSGGAQVSTKAITILEHLFKVEVQFFVAISVGLLKSGL